MLIVGPASSFNVGPTSSFLPPLCLATIIILLFLPPPHTHTSFPQPASPAITSTLRALPYLPPPLRYEGLGREGAHSLYRWYRAYEQQHFPDPGGVRLLAEAWTLGLYPRVLQVRGGCCRCR